MIWVPNQLIGASLGEEITLECTTEAFPLSLNYWTKEDTFMIVNSDKYKMSNSENTYKVHMKLTIKKVTAEDFGTLQSTLPLVSFNPWLIVGTYRCYAKNSLSSTQGAIRIYGEFKYLFSKLTIYDDANPPHLTCFFPEIHRASNLKTKEPSTARIQSLNGI